MSIFYPTGKRARCDVIVSVVAPQAAAQLGAFDRDSWVRTAKLAQYGSREG